MTDQLSTRFVKVRFKAPDDPRLTICFLKVESDQRGVLRGWEVKADGTRVEGRDQQGRPVERLHIIDKRCIVNIREYRMSRKYGELQPKEGE